MARCVGRLAIDAGYYVCQMQFTLQRFTWILARKEGGVQARGKKRADGDHPSI